MLGVTPARDADPITVYTPYFLLLGGLDGTVPPINESPHEVSFLKPLDGVAVKEFNIQVTIMGNHMNYNNIYIYI